MIETSGEEDAMHGSGKMARQRIERIDRPQDIFIISPPLETMSCPSCLISLLINALLEFDLFPQLLDQILVRGLGDDAVKLHAVIVDKTDPRNRDIIDHPIVSFFF